jgi:hypothetical protein
MYLASITYAQDNYRTSIYKLVKALNPEEAYLKAQNYCVNQLLSKEYNISISDPIE